LHLSQLFPILSNNDAASALMVHPGIHCYQGSSQKFGAPWVTSRREKLKVRNLSLGTMGEPTHPESRRRTVAGFRVSRKIPCEGRPWKVYPTFTRNRPGPKILDDFLIRLDFSFTSYFRSTENCHAGTRKEQ